MILAALLVGGYFLFYGPSTHNTSNQTSSSQSTDKSSTPKKKATSSSKSSSATVTASDLVGLNFSLTPVLYNGEAVDAAMDANRAPQNTIHDNARIGYFKSDTIAFIGGASATILPHDTNYMVSSGYLLVDDKRFKLELSNGELVTQHYNQTYSDGNTLTWELKSDPEAKSLLDERTQSSSQSSSSETASSVDTKNLTSAQMEHWVRSVIKEGSQVYNASDYTFKQSFVDGYAQIEEFAVNPKTNKNDSIAIYRVNDTGQLEVKVDGTDYGWHVVAASYY